MKRARGEPAPYQTVAGSSRCCLGALGTLWGPFGDLAVLAALEPGAFALCPCVPSAVAPCCRGSVRAVRLSLAFPRRWFCTSSVAPLLPTWSPRQLAAGVGVLQVSLGCSAGSGVGWLQALEDSPALLIWKTLSVTTKNGDGA